MKLVAAMLAGPIAWAIFHTVAYMYVSADCTGARIPVVLAFGVSAIAVAVGAAVVALRERSDAAQARFLAGVALGTSALFAFVVVMQLVATIVVAPCD
jgi:hypothetical protein